MNTWLIWIRYPLSSPISHHLLTAVGLEYSSLQVVLREASWSSPFRFNLDSLTGFEGHLLALGLVAQFPHEGLAHL